MSFRIGAVAVDIGRFRRSTAVLESGITRMIARSDRGIAGRWGHSDAKTVRNVGPKWTGVRRAVPALDICIASARHPFAFAPMPRDFYGP